MGRTPAIALLAMIGTSAVLPGQPELRLKARPPETDDLRLADEGPEPAPRKTLNPLRRHQIVQFAEAPTPADLEGLVGQGAAVLQYVPDHAVLISAPAEDFHADPGKVVLGAALRDSDKLSPGLALESSASAMAVAEFYPDVDAAGARQIATLENIRVVEHPDLAANHLLIEASSDQLRNLAAWDELSYVYPASEGLVNAERVHSCTGAETAIGMVGQYVAKVGEGWDGPGRNAASLRYAIGALTSKLPADAARAEILRALAEWSKVVKVDFTAAPAARATASIDILFASGAHGDAYVFDGPGRTLAHTFYPAPPNPEPLAGDLHLDAAESWRIGNDVDLYSVVLHELGHALGLAHSDTPGTVMYPYYSRATALTGEDIAAIRSLYAGRTEAAAPPPNNPAPTPPSRPDRIAPTIAVQSPQGTSVSTHSDAIVIKGTARDNIGVSRVTWTSNVFGVHTADGTSPWYAAVPLALGQNTIVVRAYDAAGNSSWRSLVITRK